MCHVHWLHSDWSIGCTMTGVGARVRSGADGLVTMKCGGKASDMFSLYAVTCTAVDMHSSTHGLVAMTSA